MIKRKQISTVLILSLASCILILGAINKISPTIDITEYQDVIFERLNQALQRKISIEGRLLLKIALKPTIVTKNLTIENPSWSKSPFFLESEQVEIGIDLIDLLFGKTTIDRLILSNARINLEQKTRDRNNWRFGKNKPEKGESKPANPVRLDYVLLKDVVLRYSSPEFKRKVNIDKAFLRRSIRGRYRLELNSKVSGTRLAVQLHSNRWVDFQDFRPLKIKLDAEFGETHISTELDIEQFTPALNATLKISSPMIDLNVLEKQLPPSKKSKKIPSKNNTYAMIESALGGVGSLKIDANIDRLRKGEHDIHDIWLNSQIWADKSWLEKLYLIETKGRLGKIFNRHARQRGLFGVNDEPGHGSVDLLMSGKGKTLQELIDGLVLNLNVKNLSGNKPHDFIMHDLKVNTGKDKRILFKGRGDYRGKPVELSGRTGRNVFTKLHKDKLMQAAVKLGAGKSRASIYFTLSKIFSKNKKLKFQLEGDYLAEWSKVFGRKLPLINKFTVASRMDLRHDGIKSPEFKVVTPLSNLKGRFYYHYGKPSILNIRIDKSHLVLSDLNRTPVTIENKKPQQKIPDRNTKKKIARDVMVIPRTNLMSLLSPGTEVNLEVRKSSVAFKRFAVTGLYIKMRWQKNVFAIQITAGKLAKGNLTSDIYLTVVDNEAAGKIEIKVKQLDYGSLMREMKIGDKMKGTADVNLHLVGFGKDLKEFLNHSDGVVEFVGEKGILASKYLKLWGEDIVQQILPFNWFDSEQTKMNCVVGRFDLTDGRLSSDSLLIDTEGMTIAGTGAINLDSEEMAFELMPDPKNVSLVSLATPVKIRGTMANPRIEPHKLGTTWTISSLLAGLANPAILIARFAKLGSLGENPCLAAIGKKEGEEEATSILKMFKEAVKFIQRPLDKMPDLE